MKLEGKWLTGKLDDGRIRLLPSEPTDWLASLSITKHEATGYYVPLNGLREEAHSTVHKGFLPFPPD